MVSVDAARSAFQSVLKEINEQVGVGGFAMELFHGGLRWFLNRMVPGITAADESTDVRRRLSKREARY